MPKIVKADQYGSLNWDVEDLDDDDKLESWNFSNDADGVRSMIMRIPKGYEYRMHKHLDWTQVNIISGKIRIETDKREVNIVETGETYFVRSGETHIETMLEDSTVLVLTGLGEKTKRRLVKTEIDLN